MNRQSALTMLEQMYNFYPKKLVQPPGCTFNILLIMKLTTLILITTILQVSASAYAQKVTLSERNMPLNKVFEKISDQTGYDFLISTENLKKANSVTIIAQNEELKLVLDKIFKGQPLSFVIQEKMVVISKKESAPIQSLESKVLRATIITGRVVDTTGSPLVGATVKVKGVDKSTLTDPEGVFSIQVQDGDEIDISFVGYITYSFIAKNGQGLQQVVLHASSSKLNEVIVVSNGYQTLPKDRVTGSFSQPIKAMYEDRVSTDVLSKLEGITSGVLFNANTSASQNGIDISVRGRSTIFANDQPLIVVDNFPYSGSINNINPNDVESITLLKDAASASIWGVRAGNGVIVITTKKGAVNKPLKIGFNANLTIYNKPDLNYNPNQLSSSSYIQLEKYLFNQGYYDANLTDITNYPVISPAVSLMAAQRAGNITTADLTTQLNALSKINVNDQLSKYFYRKATDQQYAINFSGGSNKAIYYFSAGYDEDLASLKNNANQRITINTQNTFFPVKNLEISVGLNAVQTNSTIDNTYALTRGSIFPYTKIADNNGQPLIIPFGYSQSYIQSAPANGFLDWTYAPLKQLGEPDNRSKTNDIRFSTGLKYTLVKGLNAELRYQYENSNFQNRDFESQDTYSTRNLINEFTITNNGQVTGYNIPLGGILGLSNSDIVSNNVRGQLNYNLNWTNNSITALAGYELSQTVGDNSSSYLYGYNNDNATFTNINAVTSFATNPSGSPSAINSGLGTGETIDRFRSAFANIAYTYRDRYTVSGSARIDGSNYFGVATNQKSVPLWSTGTKWDIDKEQFYKLSWLPKLSLRATYGYNGNLDRSVTGVTTFQYSNNAPVTNLPYALISNIGNPDLRWEKTGIANFGIDFGATNNIISGSLEYYLKNETDLLGFRNFPTNSGITLLEGNYSDMKGQGFDLSVTTKNLNGPVKWTTTVLFSHAADKVTRYDVVPNALTLVGSDGNGSLAEPNLGKPVFGVYSYKWGGLDATNGNPTGFLNGAKSEDYANIIQNTPVSSLIYNGPARPTYFGGLNNRITYKRLSLAIQLNYKLGYYFRKPTINYNQITSSGTSFLVVNNDFDKRWQAPGDEKTTNVPSLVYPFSQSRDQFYQYSQVNVENGDNIRLQDISLSYELNKSDYPHLPFSNLQLFLYGNNIWLIWKANHVGLDPDAVPGQGDYSVTPNPRSVSFGLKGNF
jgi:TonB-linked SusC/RagA family outer membrane protein